MTATGRSDAVAVMTEGFKASFGEVSKASTTTRFFTSTEAVIGDGARIEADGNITVSSYDNITAKTEVNGKSIGILVSANKKYAENDAQQRVKTDIGRAALRAGGNMSILGTADAQMSAYTNAESAGIFEGGNLTAITKLDRQADVLVRSGAVLEAGTKQSGTVLTVKSETGENDNIRTEATGKSAGLVTVSRASASSSVVSRTTTTIEKGATLTNTFGTLYVQALSSTYGVTKGHYGSVGLGSYPEADSGKDEPWNDYYLTSAVSIGKSGSGDPAVLTGKNVDIYAGIRKLYAEAYSYAKTTGAHGRAWAYSYIRYYPTTTVEVDSAELRAYNDLSVRASATPLNGGKNFYIYAGTKITAFVGQIWSRAELQGNVHSHVAFTGNTSVRAQNATISATDFDGWADIDAHGVHRAITVKHEDEHNYLKQDRNNTYVDIADAHFLIGGGAAGIAIRVDENGKVAAAGANVVGKDAMSIANAAAGTLRVSSSGVNKRTDYDVSAVRYIPFVDIINLGDADISIDVIDTYNESLAMPTIIGGTRRAGSEQEAVETPVTIRSYGNGNVKIGTIANENGTVTIEWVGGGHGKLTGEPIQSDAAHIWAHKLTVIGADTIGESSNPLRAFLTGGLKTTENPDGTDPSVSLDAQGDINVTLTLADISVATDASDLNNIKGDKLNYTLILDDIKSANGSVNVTLGKPIRMKYLAVGSDVTIPNPGSAYFVTGSKPLGADQNLSGPDLDRYETDRSFIGNRTYTLPNGVVLTVDSTGRVIRAEYNGVQMDTSVYQITNGRLVLVGTEESGVHLELATGKLTIDRDFLGSYTITLATNNMEELLKGNYLGGYTNDKGQYVKDQVVEYRAFELHRMDASAENGYYDAVAKEWYEERVEGWPTGHVYSDRGIYIMDSAQDWSYAKLTGADTSTSLYTFEVDNTHPQYPVLHEVIRSGYKAQWSKTTIKSPSYANDDTTKQRTYTVSTKRNDATISWQYTQTYTVSEDGKTTTYDALSGPQNVSVTYGGNSYDVTLSGGVYTIDPTSKGLPSSICKNGLGFSISTKTGSDNTLSECEVTWYEIEVIERIKGDSKTVTATYKDEDGTEHEVTEIGDDGKEHPVTYTYTEHIGYSGTTQYQLITSDSVEYLYVTAADNRAYAIDIPKDENGNQIGNPTVTFTTIGDGSGSDGSVKGEPEDTKAQQPVIAYLYETNGMYYLDASLSVGKNGILTVVPQQGTSSGTSTQSIATYAANSSVYFTFNAHNGDFTLYDASGKIISYADGTVTLPAGSSVSAELVAETPTVRIYRYVDGSYFYQTRGDVKTDWSTISANAATVPEPTTTVTTSEDGKTVKTITTTTVKTSDNKTLAVINKIVTTTTNENGTTTETTTYTQDIYSADGSEVEYQVDESGRITDNTANGGNSYAVSIDGQIDYKVGTISAAGDVKLKFDSKESGLVRKDDSAASDKNLVAGGDLIVIGSPTGDFGTVKDPLGVDINGQMIFRESETSKDNIITANMTYTVGEKGMLELGANTIIRGATVNITGRGTLTGVGLTVEDEVKTDGTRREGILNIAVGKIAGLGNLGAANGGTLNVTADSIDVGNLEITGSGTTADIKTGDLTVGKTASITDGAKLTLTADGAIAIDHTTIRNNSTATITTGGRFTGHTFDSADSQTELTATGDVDLTGGHDAATGASAPTLSVSGGSLTLKSETGSLKSTDSGDGWKFDNATVNITVDKDLLAYDFVRSTNSNVTMTARTGGAETKDYAGTDGVVKTGWSITGGSLTLRTADDIAISHLESDGAQLHVSSLKDETGAATDDESAAVSDKDAGKITSTDWVLKNTTGEIVASNDIHLAAASVTGGNLTVRSRTGKLDVTGKLAQSGGKLNLELAGTTTIGALELENGADFALGALMNKDGTALRKTDADSDATYGGGLRLGSWTMDGATATIRTWDSVTVDGDANLTDSRVTLRSLAGGLRNVDSDGESHFNITGGTFNAALKGDANVDHLAASGATVTVKGNAYNGKTVSAENGGSLTLDFAGDVTVKNGGADNGNAIDVAGASLTVKSAAGTLKSDANDSWNFSGAGTSLIDTATAPVVGKLTVTDGADLTITAKSGAMASDSWTVDGATLDVTAPGGLTVGELTGSKADITLKTDGDINSNTWGLTDSTVNASAGGDVTVPTVSAAGGTTTISAGGALNIKNELTATGGAFTADSKLDAALGNVTSSADLIVRTDGALTTGDWTITGGDVNVGSKGDMTLGSVTSTDTDTAFESGGKITTGDLTANGGALTVKAASDLVAGKVTSEKSDLDLVSVGGKLTSDTLHVTGGTADVTANGDVLVRDTIELKDAVTNITSATGTVTNRDHFVTDGSESGSHTTVSGGSLSVKAAGDVTLDDLKIENKATMDVISESGTLVSRDLTVGADSKLGLTTDKDMIVTGEKNVIGEVTSTTNDIVIKDPATGHDPSADQVYLTPGKSKPSSDARSLMSNDVGSIRMNPALYFFFYSDSIGAATATLKIYDRDGNEVWTETVSGSLLVGKAAFATENAYAKLTPGETYTYELTVNGETASAGTITMPGSTDTLSRVDQSDKIIAKLAGAAYNTLARAIAAVDTAADRTITLLEDSYEVITVETALTILRQNGATAGNLKAGTGIVKRVTDEAYRFFYEGFAIAYDGTNVSVEYHFESAMTGKLLIAAYDADGRMIGLTSTAITDSEDGPTDPAALKTKGTVAEIRVFFVADETTYTPLHEQGTTAKRV